MRKFITTNIVDPVKAPLTEKALRHINEIPNDLGSSLVKSMIGTYTTNDLIVLEGCVVVANIGGTSTVTAGSIFYNGEIYLVDANASISSPANTLYWEAVNTLVDGAQTTFSDAVAYDFLSIRKLRLVNGISGGGLADYNGPTVKYLSAQIIITGNTYPNEAIIGLTTVSGCGVGINQEEAVGDLGISFLKEGGLMKCVGQLYVTVPDITASNLFESGSGYAIGFVKIELSTAYKGVQYPGNISKNTGIAICTLGGAAAIQTRSYGSSNSAAIFINSDGDIYIYRIFQPGANKRIHIAFSIDYKIAN